MTKKALSELKKENLRKVFYAALERKSTSRTVICEDTGLSFVTVDKIVDALVDAEILKQTVSAKSSAVKRRSRVLSVRPFYWIAIYVILPQKYYMYLFDLSLRCIKSFAYTPEDTIFLDDTLNAFLYRASKFAKRHVNFDNCCGTGILVAGNYNEADDNVTSSPISHIRSIKIKKFFSAYLFGTEPRVSSVYTAFSKEAGRCDKAPQNTYALFLNSSAIFASYISKGFVSDIKDIGEYKNSRQRTLSRTLRTFPKPESLCHDLCGLLRSLIDSLPIDRICICDSLYNNAESICRLMNRIMCEENQIDCKALPEIIPCDLLEYSARFISREIRECWFEKKIMSDNA